MRLAFVFPGQGSQSVGMLNGFSGNAVVVTTCGARMRRSVSRSQS